MRRLLLAVAAVIALAVYFVAFWPVRNPHPQTVPTRGTLAIKDVKIYASPDLPPIPQATIIMKDGVISTIAPAAEIPSEAQTITCPNCIATAGFWNAHVHFSQPKFIAAPYAKSSELNAYLDDMLSSRGFTSVVDTGSDLRVTLSLRRRIETGDLLGPRIYTAGAGQYPPNGIPYYLKDDIPKFIQWLMPTPATPEEAARTAERNFSTGADVLKLFTGSYIARGKVLPMPEANAKAAVDVAHRLGHLAYAHPSNLAGTRIAMNAGVDILAHAPDKPAGIDATMLGEIKSRNMAMVPTLKMFATTVTTKDGYIQPIHNVVRQFHSLGGELLFGTDVGYMTDYTTTYEFNALADCGLTYIDILRMLTTAPAARFKQQNRAVVAPGNPADLVLLSEDPANNPAAFAKVNYTIRNGRVIHALK